MKIVKTGAFWYHRGLAFHLACHLDKFSSVRRPPILVPPVCRLLRRPTPPPRRLEKPNPRQAHCLLGEIVRRHGLHLGRWDNSHRRVTLPAGNSFNRWFVSPQGHGGEVWSVGSPDVGASAFGLASKNLSRLPLRILATTSSSDHEISSILCDPKVKYFVHDPPPVPNPNYINPLHALILSRIHFNIILT